MVRTLTARPYCISTLVEFNSPRDRYTTCSTSATPAGDSQYRNSPQCNCLCTDHSYSQSTTKCNNPTHRTSTESTTAESHSTSTNCTQSARHTAPSEGRYPESP